MARLSEPLTGSMARSFLCMIAFASLLLSAPSLAAEPARRALRLRYSEDAQAASCPGERALRERIRLRVGYDPFREDATEEVDVAIEASRRPRRRDDHLPERRRAGLRPRL